MRLALVTIVLAGACAEHGSRPDGSVPDATLDRCAALPGTANVGLTVGTTTTFTRLHAGGILQSGPVAPGAPEGPLAPMTLDLVFVNDDPLLANTARCCAASEASCCAADGIVAHSIGSLAPGAEIGAHPVQILDTKGSFQLQGSITIDQF